jgi:NADPH-dependent 2,4-dienoyl-CoA reductase/sulfur reductase-like enzyme
MEGLALEEIEERCPAPTVTVIGAGTMGGAMAARLLDRGNNIAA